jgi:hypothetical protein
VKINKDDYLTFETTGRETYVSFNIVGIKDNLDIYNGFDGHFGEWNEPLTKEENLELADYMIERWNKFKNKAENE